MSKKKKFHQERCTACIRAAVIDPYGRKIILYGKHAFNYSIYIEGITGNVVIETYKNGTIARKRFRELKKR